MTESDQPKTHALFMGLDVSIMEGQKAHRVQAVAGNAFVIRVGGEELRVPLESRQTKLRLDRALKMTEKTASVTKLTSERNYTAAANPIRRWAEAQRVAAAMSDAADMATARMLGAQADQVRWDAAASRGEPSLEPRPDTSVAIAGFQNAYQGLSVELGNAGAYAGQIQSEINQELFDAITVDFEVSALRPLNQPHVVIVVPYRLGGDNSGVAQNWIYAKALDPISDTPRKVHVRQGGFPPGFQPQEVQVHLYDGGEEIATSVSPKRVDLTLDEALQYVLIDHMRSHKEASVKATPALGALPPDWRNGLTAEQLNGTYFIKVSKDGAPIGAFRDKRCDEPAEQAVEALVRAIRFKPALEKGKPVESVVPLALSQLRI